MEKIELEREKFLQSEKLFFHLQFINHSFHHYETVFIHFRMRYYRVYRQ